MMQMMENLKDYDSNFLKVAMLRGTIDRIGIEYCIGYLIMSFILWKDGNQIKESIYDKSVSVGHFS